MEAKFCGRSILEDGWRSSDPNFPNHYVWMNCVTQILILRKIIKALFSSSIFHSIIDLQTWLHINLWRLYPEEVVFLRLKAAMWLSLEVNIFYVQVPEFIHTWLTLPCSKIRKLGMAYNISVKKILLFHYSVKLSLNTASRSVIEIYFCIQNSYFQR